MRKFYVNFLVASLFVLAFQLNSQAQNLIVNSDFEADGGSLNNWETASGTSLGTDGSDHYAIMHGENGVLYQKVTGITISNTYKCTMYFKNLKIKQTTGYGYAIEKDVPLVFPEFTKGAMEFRSFCDSLGAWTVLDGTQDGADVILDYDVTIPDSTAAIYICMGTKGAVSDMQVDSVVFEESVSAGVTSYSRNNENVLSVYPNPARSEVSLRIARRLNTFANYKVQIYNQVGKMIREKTISKENAKLSVQDLTPGLYFIKVPEINGIAKMFVGD